MKTLGSQLLLPSVEEKRFPHSTSLRLEDVDLQIGDFVARFQADIFSMYFGAKKKKKNPLMANK